MSDYVVSLLRTVVPVVWGSILAAFLARVPVPADVEEVLVDFGAVLVVVLIAAWYALARWLEPRLPDWLRVVLLGSANAPAYPRPGEAVVGSGTVIVADLGSAADDGVLTVDEVDDVIPDGDGKYRAGG